MTEAVGPGRRRSPRGREVVAVAAALVGGIWLALHLAEIRLPSFGQNEIVPTASRAEAGVVVVDGGRRELASLPRERPAKPKAKPGAGPVEAGAKTGGGHSNGDASSGSSGTGGSSGTKDGDDPAPPLPPPPPAETENPPLVEANVPGVGTVTVEEPDLPDVEDALPGTPTLPLP